MGVAKRVYLKNAHVYQPSPARLLIFALGRINGFWRRRIVKA